MTKPTDRNRNKERPTMADYRMLYGRIDQPPPKATAQPTETPPPKK